MQTASGQTIEVLAHRGLWKDRTQGNSRPALQTALAAGYGLETDLRDYLGDVAIVHDPPRSADLLFRQLLEDYRAANRDATLALNIKADGLSQAVGMLLDEFEIEHYFVFDMSVPDMMHWRRAGRRYFTRHSDVEPEPVLYEQAAGVWLDGFESTWFTAGTIQSHLTRGKDVCVVSPELHGRDPLAVWSGLRTLTWETAARLSLCTDLPAEFAGTGP